MTIPTEAIEAGAKALSPHLFDGRHEAAMRNMPNLFTPEQAAEAAEAKRNERLGDVELILTAAAPHIQAAALREAAEDSRMGPVPYGWNASGVASWLRARAVTIEGKDS